MGVVREGWDSVRLVRRYMRVDMSMRGREQCVRGGGMACGVGAAV